MSISTVILTRSKSWNQDVERNFGATEENLSDILAKPSSKDTFVKLLINDLKIYKKVINYDDVNLHQNSIIFICFDNRLKINRDKCAYISFSRKKSFTDFVSYGCTFIRT